MQFSDVTPFMLELGLTRLVRASMALSPSAVATAAEHAMATELTEARMAMVNIRDRLTAIERMMTEVG